MTRLMLIVTTKHSDGSLSCRGWTLTPEQVADAIRGLGEPVREWHTPADRVRQLGPVTAAAAVVVSRE